MTEPHEPRKPDPAVPPLETIDDSQRIPRPRQPSTPRPEPIHTVDDVPTGAIIAFAVLGIVAVLLTLKWGVPKVIDWSHHQDWSWFTQWTATVADPVHAYLTAHTAGLPLTASSAFVIWQGVGIASLALSWFTGAVGARLTWIAHGVCSVLMVWDASPAAGRPVAAALAVLAWTIGSFFALRGLSLRPLINIHNHPAR
ncbi:hypothetical protein [Streptomyces antarcticus]|uniref:hypothetical protein n=1 Tax=Streptomyces antarcticus TaxID=2996458 RepID=UPI00226EB21D|nr:MULTISPECIES: hypothetical protein [unclassified Streptomyces]MCY0946997.1 hypothetical protein [Streptomyces sp. H34-AA3]MCZ4088120.1 hypothetical protein [Streptomyces sp. H34-S5]